MTNANRLHIGRKTRYLCPLCGKPKGDYTPKPDDGWWVGCFSASCDTGGEYLRVLAEYIGAPHGAAVLDDPPQWLSHLAVGATATGGTAPALPKPRQVTRWAYALRRHPAAQEYLVGQRGLSAEALRTARVGYHRDRKTLVFPMYRAGELVTFKTRRPRPGEVMLKPRGSSVWDWPLYPEPQRGFGWTFLTEGELDALRLRSIGQPATSITGGAGHWRPEWTADLQGLRVTVLFDVGAEEIAGRRAEQLRAAGIRAKWIDLRKLGLSDRNADVSDYLNGGGELDALLAHVPTAWRAS